MVIVNATKGSTNYYANTNYDDLFRSKGLKGAVIIYELDAS